MSTKNIESIYPLSPMQQGMLFHSLYAPESGHYMEQISCKLVGELDTGAFQRAWQRVVDRHAILRTAFVWRKVDQPMQVVHKQLTLPFSVKDISDLSHEEQESYLANFIRADHQQNFDLSKAPLMRITVFRRADDLHHLVWTHHHLLVDGWSLPLIIGEVLAFYEKFRQGEDLELPKPPLFRDYISWLQRQDLVVAENFWRKYLKGFTAPTPLGIERSARNESSEAYIPVKEIRRIVDPAAAQAIHEFTRENGFTLSLVIQSAWAILLSRYSREEDVVFGATYSGRNADVPGIESMVGVMINTLPVRMQVKPQTPVVEWIREMQAQQAGLSLYEYCPLVKIQDWSEVPHSQPLFESLLVVENYPVNLEPDRLTNLQLEDLESLGRTNFPLALIASSRDALELKVNFDPERIDEETAVRVLGHLETLLTAIAASPEAAIASLPVLTEEERRVILDEWAGKDEPFPGHLCAPALFEEQVALRPDAPALEFEGMTLSYSELNRLANQLAHWLQKNGVGPDTITGVLLDRTPEMIVSILGIQKAGGAFMPMDPSYPEDRLLYMLEDSKAGILLTNRYWSEKWQDLQLESGAKIVCLEAEWPAINGEPAETPANPARPDNLAYVIYTSGSTGRPKGTMLEHKGLVNLATFLSRDFHIGPDKRVLQFASASFDSSVAEIFTALCTGATLVLVHKDIITSVPNLDRFLRHRKINVITLPPSLLALLPDNLPDLEVVVSAGEACTVEIANRWVKGRIFINGYGPTEGTVCATNYTMVKPLPGVSRIPIGRPMTNTCVYVLDSNLQPVPVGVAGELHIGGVSLARGYLNRPDLTAEKFIPNPFSSSENARLYKTGDLVRWLPDGNLEFLGRIDHQVKLRGFRVELGEIESVLAQHPSILQAVVTAWTNDDGEKSLVAYLVARDPENQPDPADLRPYLQEKLPDFMIPSFYIFLDEMPLSGSGKINRKALPDPKTLAVSVPAAAMVLPRTHTEEILVGIWSRILNLPTVSVTANFFEVGGHSLLATRVMSRIREVFQVELPIRILFESATLAELAEHIDQALRGEMEDQAEGQDEFSIIPRTGSIPLSYAQKRLWFLDQLEPGNPFYNLPAAVQLKGELDVEALRKSLEAIVHRHESLRTNFDTVDGMPVQVIRQPGPFELPVVDLTHLPAGEREAEVQRLGLEEVRRPMDLAKDMLLRVKLFRLAEDDHVLVLTIHHIISDGWSMGVLIRELGALYAGYTSQSPVELPELPIQYADYAAWQQEYLSGERMEKLLDYWKRQLENLPGLLELPTDYPRPAVQSYRGDHYSFEINSDTVNRLRAFCNQEGVTVYMALLSIYQLLLSRYTGEEDIPVGTAIANRTRKQVEGLIGFFVNTLVLRGDLSGEPSFRELLKRTRKVCLDAYTHQDMPFETLVDILQPERNMSHSPLFQVAFDLQNPTPLPDAMGALQVIPLTLHNKTTSYDMLLSISDTPQGLAGSVDFAADLFERSTIQRMMEHFQMLIDSALANPDQPITHLPMLSQAERKQILEDWNATRHPFQDQVCAHQLFEAWAEKQPDADALVFASRESFNGNAPRLSYQALNHRANALAHHLRSLGLRPGKLAAIFCNRSFDMVTGILAVLKAGGAYIPVDPEYPSDRIEFMLQDSQAAIILTQSHLVENLPENQAQVICLDQLLPQLQKSPLPEIQPLATADDLAYVIYTSGSTGKPKGTLLHHRGLCNLVEWQRRTFEIEPGHRVLQFASASFDASVWEMFMALGNGATLILAPQELLSSAPDLAKMMAEQNVNTATLPPTMLSVLPRTALPALKNIIAAGEACPVELVQAWASRSNGAHARRFFNAYGPTETTVCASAHLCDPGDPLPPPIGRPIDNTRLYVLDAHLEPVPAGVPGELYIGGAGVARGYLNRPELTSSRFIPDPFAPEGTGTLYKTGDRVRWRRVGRHAEEGVLEFLGRLDNQVKIRGFRIELGEVENALLQYPGVQQAVAAAREDPTSSNPQDKRLVAYLVNDPALPEPSWAEMRSFLQARLPDFMIPSSFVWMEALPLTPNGKVDRKRLPDPQKAAHNRPFIAPRTQTEIELAQICSDLLKVEAVSLDSNFFEMGGNSLLATQFTARIREQFQVEIPLRTLFEQPTVELLAAAIDRAKPQDGSQMDRIADLMDMMNSMSEEEVLRMLNEENTSMPEEKV